VGTINLGGNGEGIRRLHGHEGGVDRLFERTRVQWGVLRKSSEEGKGLRGGGRNEECKVRGGKKGKGGRR